VTPFAAGCAVCGADIAAVRAERAGKRSSQLRDRVSVPRLGDDGLRFIIALLVVLGAPPFGLILAGYFAWQAHNEGRERTRNLMIALVMLAFLPLAFGVPVWWLLPGR
jgi:hypothetical protein